MAKKGVVFLSLFVLIRKLVVRKTPERIADISMMAGKEFRGRKCFRASLGEERPERIFSVITRRYPF